MAHFNRPRNEAHPSSQEVNTLVALFNEARYPEAIDRARGMTRRYPRHPFGWKVLGAIFKLLGQPSEALDFMQTAVTLAPGDAEAHNNLAAALQDLGRSGEAEASSRKALTISPSFAEAYSNLGNALKDLGQLPEAVASYRRAVAIKPDYAIAHSNLGNALKGLGRLDEAVVSCREAVQIKPDLVEAHNNLGNALADLGRFTEAEASYRRALELKPDFTEAHSNLLFLRQFQLEQPATKVLDEARRFGDMVGRRARPFTEWPNSREIDRCLRVGLVSGDLCGHPVGYFLESMLMAQRDSGAHRLEFIAYATHARRDALTERIKSCCCDWHVAVGLSDEQLARRIYDDRIDVLLDLAGHTAYNRLPMFAWKPAPVQASWIGYLVTTGVAAMDYLIADPWTLPESEATHFTEEIWRLPECYLCFTRPHADLPVSASPAITNGYVTFGCFNNLTKMNDAVVSLWAKILLAAPGSRLFLKTAQLKQKTSCDEVSSRFAAHGIEARRLILEGPSPRAELLASYGRVDIALDPFPYPGITTSIEAMWMGVPVLTLAGKSFLSRQGVGINMNTGMSEWIASDAEDYIARAVAHAGDRPRLATLRAGLRQQLLASPLLDAPQFARHFEAAVRGMWSKWCK